MGAMLHLIKMWLESPVEETDEHGDKHHSACNQTEDGALRRIFNQSFAQQFVHHRLVLR